MNRDSNIYTVVYAAVMVVVVAVILAFLSQSLRGLQTKNQENDKRQQILRSINISVSSNDAETEYNALIKKAFIVNADGQEVPGDAFALDTQKGQRDGLFPVFVADVDGQTKYIMAMYGAGLWGPIWGYISVDANKNTVYGADLDRKSVV